MQKGPDRFVYKNTKKQVFRHQKTKKKQKKINVIQHNFMSDLVLKLLILIFDNPQKNF